MPVRGAVVPILMLLSAPAAAQDNPPVPASAAVAAPAVAAPAAAAPAVAPAETSAEVSIVAGNVASAKRRALDEALALAVERAFAESLVEVGVDATAPLPARLADLRAGLRAGARRFVRSYRLLGEEELSGRFRVRLDVTVDGAGLRRAMSDAGGKNAGPAQPALDLLLLAETAASPITARLLQALVSQGVNAVAIARPAQSVSEVRATRNPAHAGPVVLLSTSTELAGEVRGADLHAASCGLAATVFARDDRAVGTVSLREHGFGAADADAGRSCLDALTAAAIPQVAALVAATGRLDAARTITAVFLFDQPAVVERILAGLGRLSQVSRGELRRVSPGWAEFRVITDVAAAALAPVLVRELDKDVQVQIVEVVGTTVRARARLPEPPPVEAPLPPVPVPAGARP